MGGATLPDIDRLVGYCATVVAICRLEAEGSWGICHWQSKVRVGSGF